MTLESQRWDQGGLQGGKPRTLGLQEAIWVEHYCAFCGPFLLLILGFPLH